MLKADKIAAVTFISRLNLLNQHIQALAISEQWIKQVSLPPQEVDDALARVMLASTQHNVSRLLALLQCAQPDWFVFLCAELFKSRGYRMIDNFNLQLEGYTEKWNDLLAIKADDANLKTMIEIACAKLTTAEQFAGLLNGIMERKHTALQAVVVEYLITQKEELFFALLRLLSDVQSPHVFIQQVALVVQNNEELQNRLSDAAIVQWLHDDDQDKARVPCALQFIFAMRGLDVRALVEQAFTADILEEMLKRVGDKADLLLAMASVMSKYPEQYYQNIDSVLMMVAKLRQNSPDHPDIIARILPVHIAIHEDAVAAKIALIQASRRRLSDEEGDEFWVQDDHDALLAGLDFLNDSEDDYENYKKELERDDVQALIKFDRDKVDTSYKGAAVWQSRHQYQFVDIRGAEDFKTAITNGNYESCLFLLEQRLQAVQGIAYSKLEKDVHQAQEILAHLELTLPQAMPALVLRQVDPNVAGREDDPQRREQMLHCYSVLQRCLQPMRALLHVLQQVHRERFDELQAVLQENFSQLIDSVMGEAFHNTDASDYVDRILRLERAFNSVLLTMIVQNGLAQGCDTQKARADLLSRYRFLGGVLSPTLPVVTRAQVNDHEGQACTIYDAAVPLTVKTEEQKKQLQQRQFELGLTMRGEAILAYCFAEQIADDTTALSAQSRYETPFGLKNPYYRQVQVRKADGSVDNTYFGRMATPVGVGDADTPALTIYAGENLNQQALANVQALSRTAPQQESTPVILTTYNRRPVRWLDADNKESLMYQHTTAAVNGHSEPQFLYIPQNGWPTAKPPQLGEDHQEGWRAWFDSFRNFESRILPEGYKARLRWFKANGVDPDKLPFRAREAVKAAAAVVAVKDSKTDKLVYIMCASGQDRTGNGDELVVRQFLSEVLGYATDALRAGSVIDNLRCAMNVQAYLAAHMAPGSSGQKAKSEPRYDWKRVFSLWDHWYHQGHVFSDTYRAVSFNKRLTKTNKGAVVDPLDAAVVLDPNQQQALNAFAETKVAAFWQAMVELTFPVAVLTTVCCDADARAQLFPDCDKFLDRVRQFASEPNVLAILMHTVCHYDDMRARCWAPSLEQFVRELSDDVKEVFVTALLQPVPKPHFLQNVMASGGTVAAQVVADRHIISNRQYLGLLEAYSQIDVAQCAALFYSRWRQLTAQGQTPEQLLAFFKTTINCLKRRGRENNITGLVQNLLRHADHASLLKVLLQPQGLLGLRYILTEAQVEQIVDVILTKPSLKTALVPHLSPNRNNTAPQLPGMGGMVQLAAQYPSSLHQKLWPVYQDWQKELQWQPNRALAHWLLRAGFFAAVVGFATVALSFLGYYVTDRLAWIDEGDRIKEKVAWRFSVFEFVWILAKALYCHSSLVRHLVAVPERFLAWAFNESQLRLILPSAVPRWPAHALGRGLVWFSLFKMLFMVPTLIRVAIVNAYKKCHRAVAQRGTTIVPFHQLQEVVVRSDAQPASLLEARHKPFAAAP